MEARKLTLADKKVCPRCNINKSIVDFYNRGDKSRRRECKTCTNAILKRKTIEKNLNTTFPSIEDLPYELWKNVVECNGLYRVSNFGRVKSVENKLKRNNKGEKLINIEVSKFGYARVSMKKKKYSLHRIVAKAFILNPYNKPEVNHLNGNKLDNRAVNLEWVTKSENMIHAINVLGKKSPTEGVIGFANKIGKAVSIEINGETKLFGSTRQASIELNIPHSTLRYYLRGGKRSKKSKYTNFNLECKYIDSKLAVSCYDIDNPYK